MPEGPVHAEHRGRLSVLAGGSVIYCPRTAVRRTSRPRRRIALAVRGASGRIHRPGRLPHWADSGMGPCHRPRRRNSPTPASRRRRRPHRRGLRPPRHGLHLQARGHRPWSRARTAGRTTAAGGIDASCFPHLTSARSCERRSIGRTTRLGGQGVGHGRLPRPALCRDRPTRATTCRHLTSRHHARVTRRHPDPVGPFPQHIQCLAWLPGVDRTLIRDVSRQLCRKARQSNVHIR